MKRLDRSDEEFLTRYRNKYLRKRYVESLQRQRKIAYVITWVVGTLLCLCAITRSTEPYIIPLFAAVMAAFIYIDDKIKLFKLLDQERASKTEHQNAELSPDAAAPDEA